MVNSFHNAANWDLQAIRPQATPFALLGLVPAYKIDADLLERHYHILQKELHPDRFVNKPIEAQTAEMMSAWINKAYTALKDPVLRAKALLRVKGCAVPEDQTLTDITILEEAMEWRQRVEEIQSSAEQEILIKNLENSFKKCEEDFDLAWDKSDEESLKINYLRLSYLTKVQQQAKESILSPSLQRA